MLQPLLLLLALVGIVWGSEDDITCYDYRGPRSQMFLEPKKCTGKQCVVATAQDFIATHCAPGYCSWAAKNFVENLLKYQMGKAGIPVNKRNEGLVLRCCDSDLCNFYDDSFEYENENEIQCYKYDGLKSEMSGSTDRCAGHSCLSVTSQNHIATGCAACDSITPEAGRKVVDWFKEKFGATISGVHCCTGHLCNAVYRYGNGGNGGSDVVVPLEKPKKGVECYSFGGLKSQMMGNATKCSDKTACVTAFALDYMFTHCIDCYEVSPNVRKSAVEAFREDYGVVVKEEDVEIECCSSNLCNAVYEKEIILECYSYSGLKSEMMKNAKKCSSSSCMSVTAGDYIFSFCDECYGPTEEVRKNNVARLKKEFNVTIKEEDVDASCCIENLCNGVGVEENDLIVKGGNSLFSLPSVSLSFWTVLIYSNQ